MRGRNASNILGHGCLVLCLFIGVVVFTRGASAQRRMAPPPPDRDPFVGTWKVNPDKSNPKLTAKDVQCHWGSDRTDGPCTVAVSREGDERVLKIVAVGLTPWESAHNESRGRCDGERYLIDKTPQQSDPGPDVFRAGDASEVQQNPSGHSGSAPPSKSYSVCWYVTANLVEGETGIDLHDPNKTGMGNSFFLGTVSYWSEELSPDGQKSTYTEYKDKKRTKIKRTVVSDRIN